MEGFSEPESDMDLCTYCLSKPATTRDHTPPKALFKKPRPSNLVVVPACEECNKSFQKDDEYFLTLAMDWQASETSDGEAVTDSRLRSMDRGGGAGRGLWWPIFAKMRVVEAQTPGGIYLGQTFAVTLDIARITRTVNRIIRGLYFEMRKQPLELEATVNSIPLEIYLKLNKTDPASTDFRQFLAQLPCLTIGDGVFHCRYMFNEEAPSGSFWYLEFYRRWQFIGYTSLGGIPDQELAPPNAAES